MQRSSHGQRIFSVCITDLDPENQNRHELVLLTSFTKVRVHPVTSEGMHTVRLKSGFGFERFSKESDGYRWPCSGFLYVECLSTRRFCVFFYQEMTAFKLPAVKRINVVSWKYRLEFRYHLLCSLQRLERWIVGSGMPGSHLGFVNSTMIRVHLCKGDYFRSLDFCLSSWDDVFYQEFCGNRG